MTRPAETLPDRDRTRAGSADGPGAGARPAHPAWIVACALGVLHLALGLLAFDPTPHTGGDNAAYVSLAQSLLERGAYLELYDPATPPHTLYPPVFPGMLALAMLLGIRPWVGLKLLVVACSVAAVVLAYLWLRRRSGPGLALVVGAALAVSPGVLDLGHWVLSDVPFWAFTLLALWAFEGATVAGRRYFAVAVAATVLAYFTRSAGLPLVLAAISSLALGRNWKRLAVLGGVLGPFIALWLIRGEMHGAADYSDQFWLIQPYQPELGRIGPVDLLHRVSENAGRYVVWHLPRLAFGGDGWIPMTIGIGLLVAAIAGWVVRLRRPGVPELFFPLYLGLILVWPEVWSGERLLLPALPLILIYAAEASVLGVRRLRPSAVTPVGVLAIAGFVALGAPALARSARWGLACTTAYREGERYPCLLPEWRDYFGLAEWAREAVPEDAVVISRKPRLFYQLSGRRGRTFPFSRDTEEFFTLVREIGADFVVLDQVDDLSSTYLTAVLARRPEAFCYAGTVGDGTATLLGIVPGWESVRDRTDAPEAGEVEVAFRVCPAD